MPKNKGYTLIELLVVISIMAIMAVVGFVNFKDFSSDQVAVKAQGQVQTLLRLAQSNATSSTLCNGQGALSWFLTFDSTTVTLDCTPGSPTSSRIYTLENARVEISGCTTSILSYSIGTGTLLQDCSSVIFTIINTKDTTKTKQFKLSKGGAIDVE